jgi:cell division protein FtsI/penicillin-binding protein 2
MLRLHIVFYGFVAILSLIVVRLFYVQAIAPDQYATNDYLRTVRINPLRGSITDRHGEPLVINETRYELFAEPENIKKKHDLDDVIEDLDRILKTGEATLEAKFKTDKLWIAVDRDISFKEKDRIEKLDIFGLGFNETTRRYYPEASLAAQLVGFVGKDEDGDGVGYFGVEGYYNKDLEGLPGILKTERDVLGRPIVVGTQDKLRGEDGRELVLTIDKNTQRIAKEKLKDALKTYEAESGCVTVANPRTMEILAMTCLPDFDPAQYYEFSEKEFRNPIVTDVFEPGSIFKPLIVGAGLEEGVIKPTTTFNEKGPIKIGGYYIRTWNDKYSGKIDISHILQTSSNVGMVYIGRRLGNEKIRKYLDLYGLGQLTNIDVQGEVPSSLRSKWYPIDYATATFGQGVAVTQIQMITAFSALINDGWLMRPYVVKKMISESGTSNEIKPKKIRRILSEKTSAQVRKMLYETVLHGEAKWKIPKGYKLGGKTGTAQIAVEGSYDASKTNASYIGFAPVSDPKLIVLVTLHEPQASPWASETAAPLFFDIANDLIVEYNISPN